MNKEHHLTFNLGIANVPSDATCDDNSLKECLGMVYEEGEHKPVQEPVTVLSEVSGKLLYIHKFNNSERYIVKKSDGVYWCERTADNTLTAGTLLFEETASKQVLQVMSIGKTMIVTTTENMEYYIWKSDRYDIQQDTPEIDINFKLDDREEDAGRENGISYRRSSDGVRVSGDSSVSQETHNDTMIGMYRENVNLAHDVCKFVNPFFVRAALKMVDGTYTKFTAPILMVPSMNYNGYFDFDAQSSGSIGLNTYSYSLFYRLNNSYDAYKDLIESVVIFVSDEIEIGKVTGDIPALEDIFLATGTLADDQGVGQTREYKRSHIEGFPAERIEETIEARYYYQDWRLYITKVGFPQTREHSVIDKDLKDVRVFYKLAEIGLQSNADVWKNVKENAQEKVLTNLTTQEKVTSENSSDYFDHSKLSGKFAYVYNSRLNLSDVTRSFFEGFSYFMPYDNFTVVDPYDIHIINYNDYRAYITIRTDANEETVIMKEYSTCQKQGVWFYYPDPRATHVTIFRRNSSQQNLWECILDEALTEHKGLNGSYYFRGLPYDEEYTETVIQGVAEPTVVSSGSGYAEELTNYIIVSEVDNPTVFKAEGYVNVGVGRVKAMSTITQAVSQGQFGGFPLIAFSDNGVWALSVSNTGLITNSVPKEREVISSPQSVTQGDNAVFFVSTRGLMAVTGNGNGVEVKCISENLNGKNTFDMDFNTFLQGAKIAYDYRDSLLWIGREDSDIFWLYSIKNGTFHRYSMSEEERAARNRAPAAGDPIFNFINNYPDYLLQINGDVFSFMERPNANDDDKDYHATMVTRPMKLGGGMTLKSIMQMKQVKELNADAQMTVSIEGSNDLRTWKRLTHLRGTPWKYYRMTLEFTDLKATDRYAGMVLISQERRTNKLR